MAPRTATPLYRLAVGALIVLSLHLHLCSATLYTCVVYGTNVPSSVADQIDVDTDSLLQKLKGYEGAGYATVPRGHSVRRDLLVAGADTEDHEDEEAMEMVDEEEDGRALGRNLISCPSSCNNKPESTYCIALGCSWCTRCRRNLNLNLSRSLVSTVSVVNAINKDLAAYCRGVPGCSLWANLYVVNADGSLTPAR